MEMNEYLKNRLLELGYLQDADLAKEVYEAAKARKVPLFEVFKDFPRIDLGEVYAGLAKIFDMPYITASVYALDASLSKDIPSALISKLRIIPFAKEKERLTLVTDSPLRREEAMALAAKAGIPLDLMYDVVTHAAGNSWMFENRMKHVVEGDYAPLSMVDIFVKDLGLVTDTGKALHFPLPLASTAFNMFTEASNAGYGKEDDSAVIKIFSGIELPKKGG